MRQHLFLLVCMALMTAPVLGGQTPVLPAIVDPQSDFAPGVPRSSTPGVVPPELIKNTQVGPKYTAGAARAGIQGSVILDAVIGVDGMVEQLRVRCSLDPGLDEEAQKTLRQWRFKPAMLNGAPTPFVVVVHMAFHLHEQGSGTPPKPPRVPTCRVSNSR